MDLGRFALLPGLHVGSEDGSSPPLPCRGPERSRSLTIWVGFNVRVGRAGEGPGEFRVAFPLKFGPGDSLRVFQPSARRVTVFDSTLKYVRTLTPPTSRAAAAPFEIEQLYFKVRFPRATGLDFLFTFLAPQGS